MKSRSVQIYLYQITLSTDFRTPKQIQHGTSSAPPAHQALFVEGPVRLTSPRPQRAVDTTPWSTSPSAAQQVFQLRQRKTQRGREKRVADRPSQQKKLCVKYLMTFWWSLCVCAQGNSISPMSLRYQLSTWRGDGEMLMCCCALTLQLSFLHTSPEGLIYSLSRSLRNDITQALHSWERGASGGFGNCVLSLHVFLSVRS